MSIDFIGLFDVAVEGMTTERLLDPLAARNDVFSWFEEQYGSFFRNKAWVLEAFGERPQNLAGPGGFIIRIQGRTLELWHGIRFSLFVSDQAHREAMRRVCVVVADIVRAERAIYLHEFMPYAVDAALPDIEEALRTMIGPAAETFDDMREAKEFGPKSWYVDTFPDLRRPLGFGTVRAVPPKR